MSNDYCASLINANLFDSRVIAVVHRAKQNERWKSFFLNKEKKNLYAKRVINHVNSINRFTVKKHEEILFMVWSNSRCSILTQQLRIFNVFFMSRNYRDLWNNFILFIFFVWAVLLTLLYFIHRKWKKKLFVRTNIVNVPSRQRVSNISHSIWRRHQYR